MSETDGNGPRASELAEGRVKRVTILRIEAGLVAAASRGSERAQAQAGRAVSAAAPTGPAQEEPSLPGLPATSDDIAIEEPLEIRIAGRALGVTMRTPGNDEELAAGLLLAEGIVRGLEDIGSIVVCRDSAASALKNVVNVRLVEGVTVDWERLRRTLLTNSSCGVCGKATIEALRTRAEPLALHGAIPDALPDLADGLGAPPAGSARAAAPGPDAGMSGSDRPVSIGPDAVHAGAGRPGGSIVSVRTPGGGGSGEGLGDAGIRGSHAGISGAERPRSVPAEGGARVSAAALFSLPGALRKRQVVFEATGGLHAAGLFDLAGSLSLAREDVGRHNAVDKVIGAALIGNLMPLSERILMVSGRASYEIVQKAIMARIPIVAAVSAPSSLAVELADEFGVTLVGFLRGEAFTIYSHPARVTRVTRRTA